MSSTTKVFELDFTNNDLFTGFEDLSVNLEGYVFILKRDNACVDITLNGRTMDRLQVERLTIKELSHAVSDVYLDILMYCEAGI